MKMRNTRGFTLLEIVVALAILGMGVAVVMQIFAGGLKNIHRIDMAHQAMNHAENVMNEILSNQDISGEVSLADDLDEEFAYTAEVRYWEAPDEKFAIDIVEPGAFLLSVQVDVHFKNDPNGKLYRAVTLKTVPNESAGPARNSVDAIRQLFGARQ
jgi:prepilin-type N-terminal cleavage/methylation domain-containing protein